MSDRLFGMLGNERLELALCPLVVEKGATGAAEQGGELRPGIRRAHVDDADRLDTRSWRLGIDEVRSFTRLDAPPELLLSRYQDTQVEGIHGDRDLDPLAAAGDDRQDCRPGLGNPHIVLDLSHVLFGCGLLRERPRQHEFSLEDCSGPLHESVEGCRHPRNCTVLHQTLNVCDASASVALVPDAVELLRCCPKLHEEVAGQIFRRYLATFFTPET